MSDSLVLGPLKMQKFGFTRDQDGMLPFDFSYLQEIEYPVPLRSLSHILKVVEE